MPESGWSSAALAASFLVTNLHKNDRSGVFDAVKRVDEGGTAMRRVLLIGGLLLLAIGLFWIGQGTGVVAWPRTSFMINQLQWAGYGVGMGALGLVMIWQGTC